MVDASELAFRDLCRSLNTHLAYTPMLNSKIFIRDAHYRLENFTTHSKDRPLVAQFCATDGDLLVEAARHIQHSVDAIDINLGCPQGIARRGGYGAFLMDHLDRVENIVKTAVEGLDIPVWCKIRIFPDVEDTLAYARMLQRAGASVVAVHGRTREQKGKTAPPADWDVIKAVVDALDIPVIANGNVRTKADADRALGYTGAAGVMSAWGLLDNPALFTGVRKSRLEMTREYLKGAERMKTPMRMVRLHVFKMMRGRLDYNMDLNEMVAKCRAYEDFSRVLDVIGERCDGERCFEERVERGEDVVHVVCDKRVERERRRGEKQKKINAACS